ncbi:MAG TPA: ArsC/Spx/MgsR family protein [Candidatus Limnocylindrales bacterium]|nr:ArsC/Spx/MgsR family protein [Candidatus Limnocylindrales bacterium]
MQIFGLRDSRPTQAALRFFRERRVPVAFVDLAVRPPARGELRRFADRLGPGALLDPESRDYREQGLAWLRLEGDELFQRLLAAPGLLRLPLVRAGNGFAAGRDEAAWKALLSGQ